MTQLLGEAMRQPVVLALLVLLVFGLTGLAAAYVVARYGPALVARLASAAPESGPSLREEVEQLRSDLTLHTSRFNVDFWNRQEDRGRRLHTVANQVNALVTAREMGDREIVDMKRRLERVEVEGQKAAVDIAEIKTDTRHARERAEEACRRLEKIEGPINRIAAKLEVAEEKEAGL